MNKTLDEALLTFKELEVELHRYLNLLCFFPHEEKTRALYQEALMLYTDAARAWGALEQQEVAKQTMGQELEAYTPAPANGEMH